MCSVLVGVLVFNLAGSKTGVIFNCCGFKFSGYRQSQEAHFPSTLLFYFLVSLFSPLFSLLFSFFKNPRRTKVRVAA